MPPVPERVNAQRKQEQPTALVPYYKSECGRVVVYKGDCREVMKQLEAELIHAVVSDPPYGLEFMGQGLGRSVEVKWFDRCSTASRAVEMGEENKRRYIASSVTYGIGTEFQQWFQTCAAEMLRVCKPGAHCLTFGGTRMFHRMTCAVEDAGFELRDVVMWVYGSGFPKSHDVSKAIDRMYGAEREVVGQKSGLDGSGFGNVGHGLKSGTIDVTAPATEDALRWQGWGSSLKPSYEPCVLARKPLIGTIAQNVLEHGTGGINIDACRVGTEERWNESAGNKDLENRTTVTPISKHTETNGRPAVGRWPANLIHDGSDEVVRLFPEQAGGGKESGYNFDDSNNDNPTHIAHNIKSGIHFGDSGSAARFFYTCKANGVDRDDNHHPTVKPTDLMQYLVRLVAAKESLVMDPFMGSGSTGVACIREGVRFIGIEQSEEYCDIAVGRLKHELVQCGYAKPAAPPAVKVLRVRTKK